MLQNTAKTLGFQKIMVYKTPPGGGGKPYLARGLCVQCYTELLLGIFKKGPTPPLCSEKGATVFCHRAIQWFNRNCLIFLIWKINQT